LVSIEYLAGFLDGEGSLSLARIHRRHRSTEYTVRVAVYNSDWAILEGVQRTWGGVLARGSLRDLTWKPVHALIWTNAAAARLLPKVAPHLRVKSRHAAPLLEFDEHVRECRRVRDSGGRLWPFSGRVEGIRQAFHKRLKQLRTKGRGIAIPPSHAGGEPWAGKERDVSARYLAGFIDAEGCLMIAKSKDRDHRRPQYRARVCVGNTDRAVLGNVRRAFGGILTNQPALKTGWKHAYQVVWSDGMIEQLLSSVLPHLRIKRGQATLPLDFVRHKRSVRQGRNGRYFAPLPDDVVAFREGLHGQIKELNAKGASPTSGPKARERRALPESPPTSLGRRKAVCAGTSGRVATERDDGFCA